MPANPSAEIARRVAASPRWRRLDVSSTCLVLPTTYAALGEDLDPALSRENADAVLMIGVAGRSRRVRIERRAENRVSILLSDAAGRRPSRLTLGDGPAGRALAVSPIRLQAILRRHGVSCEVSRNAGKYLCNAAYYQALGAPVPVLFLHIPKAASRGRRGAVKHRLSFEQRLEAAFVEVAARLLALTLRDTRPPPQVAARR